MKWRARWLHGTRSHSPVFAGYDSDNDSAFSHDFNHGSEWGQESGDAPTTRVSSRCGWLGESRAKLDELARLGDDWDGYGAARPGEDAISAASVYLGRLSENCEVIRPTITPTRSGGVLLAWRSGPYRLEITFSPSEGASFVYLDLRGDANDRGNLAVLDDERRLFRLLTKRFGS